MFPILWPKFGHEFGYGGSTCSRVVGGSKANLPPITLDRGGVASRNLRKKDKESATDRPSL